MIFSEIFPLLDVETYVRAAHLVFVAVAFGAALISDILMLSRALFTRVDEYCLRAIRDLSRLVAAGLIGLWISGVALVGCVYLRNPLIFSNEKFFVKIFIVTVLSINAFFIHLYILPKLKEQVGYKIFDRLSLLTCALFALAGAVSASSWFFPTVLGVAKELNNKVNAHIILTGYYAMACVVFLGILSIALLFSHRLFGKKITSFESSRSLSKNERHP
jgi:hypothetical protein